MLTNYEAKRWLDDLISGDKWLALFIADPGRSGSLSSEVSASGTGYARCDVAGLFSAADLSTRTSRLNALITFPTSTAAWGNVSHVGLIDSATVGAGNLHIVRALSENIFVPSGYTIAFAAGQIQLRVP